MADDRSDRAFAAVARGDLQQTVRLDVNGQPFMGEFLRSAMIVNTMIKQLSVFTSEVTRVASEVGSEGKLGGQAAVPDVTGVWKDLTESVNSMASNSDGAGSQHRRRYHRHRQRRSFEEDHRRMLAARFCSSRKPSIRWSISSTPLPAR